MHLPGVELLPSGDADRRIKDELGWPTDKICPQINRTLILFRLFFVSRPALKMFHSKAISPMSFLECMRDFVWPGNGRMDVFLVPFFWRAIRIVDGRPRPLAECLTNN